MNQDDMKRAVAQAASKEITPGAILGVGTGSTVNHLIDLLANRVSDIPGAVSSSDASTRRLQAIGIPVLDLNDVDSIPVYIDGADEVTGHGHMIKGGGGALTREKIVAAASRRFVCMVDASKRVDVLGAFPLPIEVIPMARSLVTRKLVALGGRPAWREGFITDNGNLILDVAALDLTDAIGAERTITRWPGVVTVGLFAERGADILLTGTGGGVGRQEISHKN